VALGALLTAADLRDETSSIQLPKTLMRSLIQASPILGGLLIAANLSDKFHPIKVEKAHISGYFTRWVISSELERFLKFIHDL
jgi:hypothetical protein